MNEIGERDEAPAHKRRPSRAQRLWRLLGSTFDLRAWAHLVKIVNFYNYTHVQPLRKMKLGPNLSVSPTAAFSYPERIEIGAGGSIGFRCVIWAGPGKGRVVIGDDVLLGPEVMITAANYRFNDGAPVTDQAMDEADVMIGRDVWVGAKCMIMPGTIIGDGAIIAASSVVHGTIPPMTVVAGNPARVMGQRRSPSGPASDTSVVLAARANPTVTALVLREIPGLDDARMMAPVEDAGVDSFDLISLRVAIEEAVGCQIPDREWSASPRLADIARLPCLADIVPDASEQPGHIDAAPQALEADSTNADAVTSGPGWTERQLDLNMPQMALSGLSEPWLFKELGDMHWALITSFLQSTSSSIVDETGDRLYATFTRFLLEVDPSLRGFAENTPVKLGSRLSRFGTSLYLSDHEITSPEARGRARTMSTFAKYGERGRNTSLMKGSPHLPNPSAVPSLLEFPEFSTEYRDRRKKTQGTVLFECEYDLLPPHDINGVGLLYFAAYPTIFDLCIERAEGRGFLMAHSTTLKDIFYFANSEPSETLVFRLHAREETDVGLRHTASLSRKSDGVRMSEAVCEKREI